MSRFGSSSAPRRVEIWTEPRTVQIRTQIKKSAWPCRACAVLSSRAFCDEEIALRRRAYETPFCSSATVATARGFGSTHAGTGDTDARMSLGCRGPAVRKASVANWFDRLHKECENFGDCALVALAT